jgi:hypothetical protein
VPYPAFSAKSILRWSVGTVIVLFPTIEKKRFKLGSRWPNSLSFSDFDATVLLAG